MTLSASACTDYRQQQHEAFALQGMFIASALWLHDIICVSVYTPVPAAA
jgi:hypothetical protein